MGVGGAGDGIDGKVKDIIDRDFKYTPEDYDLFIDRFPRIDKKTGNLVQRITSGEEYRKRAFKPLPGTKQNIFQRVYSNIKNYFK